MIKSLKSKAGFTLIELLIVLGIIAIISAIAIPQYAVYKTKAYNTSALSDAKNCYIAVQAFLAENPSVVATAVVIANATDNGFVSTTGVLTEVGIGTGIITSAHTNGDTTYSVAVTGAITQT